MTDEEKHDPTDESKVDRRGLTSKPIADMSLDELREFMQSEVKPGRRPPSNRPVDLPIDERVRLNDRHILVINGILTVEEALSITKTQKVTSDDIIIRQLNRIISQLDKIMRNSTKQREMIIQELADIKDKVSG